MAPQCPHPYHEVRTCVVPQPDGTERVYQQIECANCCEHDVTLRIK